MKIAVPITGGVLAEHFGHCQQFAILEVDPEQKSILKTEAVTPPAHQPGVFPQWLGSLGVNIVIAGGMGMRAIQLFQSQGIQVISGAPPQEPETVVNSYLQQQLTTDANPCDHEPGQPCQGHGQGKRHNL
jgi:predicted Fe-Mo cluster-binding NifX family protein